MREAKYMFTYKILTHSICTISFLILEHIGITPYLNKTLLVHMYGVWEYVFSVSVKPNEIHNTSCWFLYVLYLENFFHLYLPKVSFALELSGIIISKW